jgi:hypothetical protein
MRYILPVMVLLAAIFFTAQQAVQFYEGGAASQAGHTILIYGISISLAGTAWVVVIFFEALFYPLGRLAFQRGEWVRGTLCMSVLLIAVGYTFTSDFDNNATGRADRMAERSAIGETREMLKRNIEAIDLQRRTWLTRVETARGRTLRELNARIDAANARVTDLEERLRNAPTNAGSTPAAEMLDGLFGKPASWWAGLLLAFRLIFPAAMRAVAWEFVLAAFEFAVPRQRPARKLPDSITKFVDHPVTVAPGHGDGATAFQQHQQPAVTASPPEVMPVSPAQALLNRNTGPAFKRVVIPTDMQLLEKVLTEQLPYGTVHLADIESDVGTACHDAGITKPTQPRIRSLLSDLKVRSAKRDKRGARYVNHLGCAKGTVSACAPGDRRPAGFQRLATA